MDEFKAAALINQHRRHWRSHEPDGAIARRAERLYLWAAAGFGLMALGDVAADAVCNRLVSWRIAIALVLLITAFAFYWQSRRFTQIRRLLANTNGETFSH